MKQEANKTPWRAPPGGASWDSCFMRTFVLRLAFGNKKSRFMKLGTPEGSLVRGANHIEIRVPSSY